MRAIRRLLDVDVAILTLRRTDDFVVVGRDGTSLESLPLSWGLDRVVDERRPTTILSAVREDERLAGHPLVEHMPFVNWMLHAPLATDAHEGSACLIALSSERHVDVSGGQFLQLQELLGIAVDIVSLLYRAKETSETDDRLPMDLDSVVRRVREDERATCVLDLNGTFLAISQACAAMNRKSVIEHEGRTVGDVVPKLAPFAQRMLERVVRTGLKVADAGLKVADAGSEVAHHGPGMPDGGDEEHVLTRAEHERFYVVTALPVAERGAVRAVLFHVREFFDPRIRGSALRRAFASEPEESTEPSRTTSERTVADPSKEGGDEASVLDPTSGFLLDTLVVKKVIRQRNGVSYLTLRSWRKSIRDSQIKALRHLKSDPPAAFVAAAADEIAAAARAAFGAAAFGSVVPVPCGHSQRDDCFSVRLARAVAPRLGTSCAEVFACQARQGSSHPRRNTALPRLRKLSDPAFPVLVVDDVASSGRHIEQVSDALGASQQGIFKIAWIGGDAS